MMRALPPRSAWLLPILIGMAVLLAGCAARRRPPAPIPPSVQVPIMAASRLSASQLAAWFKRRQAQVPGVYAATVPVEALARLFVEEGAAEGVAGDVAFVQGIVETNWYRFSGSVPASSNNFAGIGATDRNTRSATFPDARTGVRAQIQHLRAYADSRAYACTVPPLHNRCVDPRFDLVSPKGRAPTWNQIGNGNWATASSYASAILTLYSEALSFSGLRQGGAPTVTRFPRAGSGPSRTGASARAESYRSICRP